MKREIEAMLAAYADQKRRQADAIDRFGRALREVAAADEKFNQRLAEMVRTVPEPYPSYHPGYTERQQPMADLFKSFSELSRDDLDAMEKARP